MYYALTIFGDDGDERELGRQSGRAVSRVIINHDYLVGHDRLIRNCLETTGYVIGFVIDWNNNRYGESF